MEPTFSPTPERKPEDSEQPQSDSVTPSSPNPAPSPEPAPIVQPQPNASIPSQDSQQTAMPWDKPTQDSPAQVFGTAINPPQKQPKSKKKLFAVLAGVLVGLLLLGGGVAAAYFGVVVPNKPENILKQSMLNTLEENSWASKGAMKFSGSESFSGKVAYDMQADLQKKAFDGTFDITISGVDLPVEGRYVDGNAYFKVGDLQTLSSLAGGYASMLGADQAQVDQLLSTVSEKVSDQWIIVDSTLLEQAGVNCFQDINLSLTDDDKKLLQSQYEKYQFITIKNHSNDTVNNDSTIKYDFTVDGKKFADFVNGLKNLSIYKSLEKCADESGSDWDTDAEVPEETFAEDMSLTVWVDKDKKLITKSAYTAKESYSGEDSTISVEDIITYKDVSVSAPENAKPLMQLVGELQQSFNAVFPAISSGFSELEETLPIESEFDPYITQ